MPGSFSHLFRRFFDFVFAGSLSESEMSLLAAWLTPRELAVFLAQDRRDQVHGFQSGQVVAMESPTRPDLITAATMHDVGKQDARLGAMSRSFASILIKLHLPLSGRMVVYRDHGEHGARLLSSLGSEEIAITFARAHHGSRPSTIDLADWDLLQRADEPDRPHMRR